jgi:hypothetical protein
MNASGSAIYSLEINAAPGIKKAGARPRYAGGAGMDLRATFQEPVAPAVRRSWPPDTALSVSLPP